MPPVIVAVAQIDGIPNALTWSGRHWIPSEPLADPDQLDQDLGEFSAARIFADVLDRPQDMLRRVEELAIEATRGILADLLRQATADDIDVIVLPELLVHPRLLDVLVGFSRKIVIVAGLGVVHNLNIAKLVASNVTEELDPQALVSRNVAVLVNNGAVSIITKKYPAANENLESGIGPRYFDVTIKNRPLRLAIAICKDFLRCQDEIRQSGSDLVCVPTFTRNIEPFIPDAPRDYELLIANTALYGGSTICMAGLRSPAFADKRQVLPIPAHCQGIIAAEFHDHPRVPTPLVGSPNKLVIRGELVERAGVDSAFEQALSTLGDLRGATSLNRSELPTSIRRWLKHLPERGLLRDSLEALRSLLIQEVEDKDFITLLCRHYQLPENSGPRAIRGRQAAYIAKRLAELLALGRDIPRVGEKLDRYRDVAGTRPTRPGEAGENWTVSIRLGSFDRDSATGSLPRQLNLLKALSAIPDPSLSISYRIQAVPSAVREDSQAYFDVIVTGKHGILSAEEVEAELRSIFVSSWGVSGSSELALPTDIRYFVRLSLRRGVRITGLREDWSSVIDLLRTHLSKVAIDMRVSQTNELIPEDGLASNDDEVSAAIRSLGTYQYTTFMRDPSERFASAFHSLRQEAGLERRNLALSIVLSSQEPIPPLLLHTVAHEILGPLDFDVDYLDSFEHQIDGPAFSAAEVLRVFHPPYGKIQGRGIPEPDPPRKYFEAARMPTAGVSLGQARIAGPRADRDVEVRLDESTRSRHIYVIGKTGTGKTNLLKEIVRQDIDERRGVCVIDPHGDLVDYAAEHVGDRLDETLLLDFGNMDDICGFNPFLVDCDDKHSTALHITDLISVLQAQFYNQYSGPRFNDLVRLAVDTMLDERFPRPPSLSFVEDMYEDSNLSDSIGQLYRGTRIGRRWDALAAIRTSERAELMSWALSKFADLMPEGSLLRLQLCAASSPYSITDVVSRRGVFLVRIPDSRLGTQASTFLASLILKRIQRAIFNAPRATEGGDTAPFTLVIDEFQRVATAGLEPFIAEARKFNCGLILAHQNLEQLAAFSTYEGARSRELVEVILGNVGTAISYRVGPRDREVVAELLNCKPEDLENLPKFGALCRTLMDGSETSPFSLKVPDSRDRQGLPVTGVAVRSRMVESGICIPVSESLVHVSTLSAQLGGAFEPARHALDEIQAQAMSTFVNEDVVSASSIINEAVSEADTDTCAMELMRELTMFHLRTSRRSAGRIAEAVASSLEAMVDEPLDNLAPTFRKILDDYGYQGDDAVQEEWTARLIALVDAFTPEESQTVAEFALGVWKAVANREVLPVPIDEFMFWMQGDFEPQSPVAEYFDAEEISLMRRVRAIIRVFAPSVSQIMKATSEEGS